MSNRYFNKKPQFTKRVPSKWLDVTNLFVNEKPSLTAFLKTGGSINRLGVTNRFVNKKAFIGCFFKELPVQLTG